MSLDITTREPGRSDGERDRPDAADATDPRPASWARTVVKLAVVLAVGAGAVGAGTSVAHAEPDPVSPTHSTCGNWAGTCTQYWSVARTKEFNAEDKAKQNLKYFGTGTGAAVLGTVVPPAGIVLGAFAGGKALMFEQAISSAANDGRCLTFKYPRDDEVAGWWGSVNASTNENCKKANALDVGVFAG